MCPFSCSSLASCFWTGGTERSCTRAFVVVFCVVLFVSCPVRPALLEKPDSVSFSLQWFEQPLWASWLDPAHRYERDVNRLML